MSDDWDVVVVGGGPGGLAAALWLARYRRRTLVLDDDRPRNEDAWAIHGYPGVDDPHPAELRRTLREQALRAGATVERRRVVEVAGRKDAFTVRDEDGRRKAARRVVLAYGRTDRIPDIPGVRELYGRALFHCPDCDGPEVTGTRVAILGHDRAAAALALYLLTWARDVVLLTHGLDPDLDEAATRTLRRHGVAIDRRRIERLEGGRGALERARFEDGGELALDAAFFHWGSEPATQLARAAGCDCGPAGDVEVRPGTMETTVPGIYAAGDIVGRPHLAITAAADGVRAALALHRSLLPDEFELA